MFPFEIETEEEEDYLKDDEVLREYEVDFITGELTGGIVEGIEALKVWVWVALHTNRYRFEIYSWDFGHELEDMIGKTYSEEYITSETESLVEECLLVNEKIIGISDFECSIEKDKLVISFTILSVYGEGEFTTIV